MRIHIPLHAEFEFERRAVFVKLWLRTRLSTSVNHDDHLEEPPIELECRRVLLRASRGTLDQQPSIKQLRYLCSSTIIRIPWSRRQQRDHAKKN